MLDSVNWLVEHEGAQVTWLPTAADGSVSAAALREAAAEPRRRRAGLGDVGQQRGRHHHADRRTRRRRRRVRRPDAQRRRSGGGSAAGRVRRQRAFGDERDRAQVRRPAGCGRVAAAPRRQLRAAAARWRAGTRHSFRHTGCRRRCRDGGGRADRGGRAGGQQRAAAGVARPADRGCAGRDRRRSPQRCPRPAAASGQRALHLPRLRRRCAVDVVGRQRNRMLDRIGLHRRCPAAVACVDRDGRRPGQRARIAASFVGAQQC